MKFNIWKYVALFEALCIAALLTIGLWCITQARQQSRVETLHALYDYLGPDPESGAVAVPLILNLTYRNNELRYELNGVQMNGEELRDSIRRTVEKEDPVIMRPTNETPFVEIVSALRLVAEEKRKIYLLHSDKEVFALTDRNISQQNNIPDMPEKSSVK